MSNDLIDMNLTGDSFNPLKSGFECYNKDYVVHTSTQKLFTKESPLTDRLIFFVAATVGATVQAVMTVIAEVLCTIRLILLADLWCNTSANSLADRITNLSLTVLRLILVLPLAATALQVVAIFGIAFPQPAKKVYNAIENLAYGSAFISLAFIPAHTAPRTATYSRETGLAS